MRFVQSLQLSCSPTPPAVGSPGRPCKLQTHAVLPEWLTWLHFTKERGDWDGSCLCSVAWFAHLVQNFSRASVWFNYILGIYSMLVMLKSIWHFQHAIKLLSLLIIFTRAWFAGVTLVQFLILSQVLSFHVLILKHLLAGNYRSCLLGSLLSDISWSLPHVWRSKWYCGHSRKNQGMSSNVGLHTGN